MDRNLPAAPATGAPAEVDQERPLPGHRPVSVAFLPLALITFVILALIISTWTFLAAAT